MGPLRLRLLSYIALASSAFFLLKPCDSYAANRVPVLPFNIAHPDSGDEHDEHAEKDIFSSETDDDPVESLSFYDSLNKTFDYHFTYHKKNYHKQKYVTSSFSNRKIDLYRVTMSEIKDTFHFVLHDPFNGENFVCPIKGRVTSRFGPRRMFSSSFHYGTDVQLRTGDTIRACKDGVIRIARNDKHGYGNFVVITHKAGLETLYGHLSKHLVAEGESVKAGQPIGLGGSTGRSSGPHLHFEFRLLGDAFDPGRVLSFSEGKLLHNEIHIERTWFAYQNPALLAQTRAKAAGKAGPGSYHVIRSGDTLGHIAAQYNTTITELCRINGLSRSTVLQLGARIRVM